MNSDQTFSPIGNEMPLRGLRRLGLVSEGRLGAGRRAVTLALVAWCPIVAWAVITDQWGDSNSGESLLQHYGVHVRCLIAIPLLILAESALHKTAREITHQFKLSNIVSPESDSEFSRVMLDVRRLSRMSMPWVLAVGVAIAWAVAERPSSRDDAMSWAFGADGMLGFGGFWFAYVARPIFVALVLAWLWRIFLVAHFFWRIGKLELSIVPTHPDRTGGLAFLEALTGAFALVTFALSATIASHWAHLIVVHGARLQTFAMPAVLFVLLWTLILLMPLLAFAPSLISARARAIPVYSALVGEQGRLVHRRWILREAVADAPLLDAPEIGPVADAAAMYDAVRRMRIAPIGARSISHILVPIAVPFLVVAGLQIPLKELLLNLLKALS